MDDGIPPELKALCPHTLPELLCCERCNNLASRWRFDITFEWARVLYCSCGKDWLVCGLCPAVRTRLSLAKNKNKHNKICHSTEVCNESTRKSTQRNKRPKPTETGGDMYDTDIDGVDPQGTEVWVEKRMSHMKSQEEYTMVFNKDKLEERTSNNQGAYATVNADGCANSNRDFGNRNSTMYFNADINGSGLADIVALSQFGVTEPGSKLNASDVQYTTDIANFVHTLSQTQRADFSRLLAGTVAKVVRDRRSDRLWKTVIPQCPQELRKQYWEGKQSFLGNIPYPTVDALGDHAYTSVRECIRNRLAFGFCMEKVHLVDEPNVPIRCVINSPVCQRVIRKCQQMYVVPVLILFLKEWQDGYDPHSFSKTNRGSAWVKTITISEPHEHKNQAEFTYAVALGPSSSSHEDVERRLAHELRQLADPSFDNTFYSKIHGRDIRVHVELICSLMDQPERRGTNWMMGGNSLYAARWGYSINLHEVHRVLVPCESCSARLIGGDLRWNESRCNVCAQWEMIRDDSLLHWNAPKGFPLDESGKQSRLQPRKLDYGLLTYAVDHTHNKILSGQWSETEADLFLSYYCLNGKVSSGIAENARHMRALSSLAEKEDCAEDYNMLLKKKEEFPDLFRPWPIPSYWKRGLDLKSQIDAPMHLLFLGAVKGITVFVHSWLKKHEKYSDFMRRAEERLSPLVKFKLPWLKMLPYKGEKLGGWVSENFVSFAKISKWFYIVLDEIKDDGPRYTDPEGPQRQWRADENRKWLKARGLPNEGNASELREKVSTYMLDDPLPAILPQPTGCMDDIHGLICSMYGMIKSVMTFEVDKAAIELADFHIKKFLTHVVLCDSKLNPKARIPFWISSYNYPCLLNIPEHMAEYGPLKNLWEGGVRGEGYLRYMKPMHGTMGIRKGWAVQIMKKVHQKKGLGALGTSMETYETGDDDYDLDGVIDDSLLDVQCSYWKYPNADTVYADFNEGRPLCLVALQEGIYGAMLRTGDVVKFHCERTNGLLVRGMHFLHWKPDFDLNSLLTGGLVLLESNQCVVQYSCVLLPKLLSLDCVGYLAVREDYTMLDNEGNFN